MSGGKDVPVGDEDAGAVLRWRRLEQGGHPRPAPAFRRVAPDDAGLNLRLDSASFSCG